MVNKIKLCKKKRLPINLKKFTQNKYWYCDSVEQKKDLTKKFELANLVCWLKAMFPQGPVKTLYRIPCSVFRIRVSTDAKHACKFSDKLENSMQGIAILRIQLIISRTLVVSEGKLWIVVNSKHLNTVLQLNSDNFVPKYPDCVEVFQHNLGAKLPDRIRHFLDANDKFSFGCENWTTMWKHSLRNTKRPLSVVSDHDWALSYTPEFEKNNPSRRCIRLDKRRKCKY